MKHDFTTLVEILQYRAQYQPQQTAYIFLQDGARREQKISYHQLDMRCRMLATQIYSTVEPSSRIIVLCPAGLEFITAFFGCLYAGVVAVPTYPPDVVNMENAVKRFLAIHQETEAQAIVTTSKILPTLEHVAQKFPVLQQPRWLLVDDLIAKESNLEIPQIEAKDLAFIQYTSGTTNNSKGAMLTHANILYNQQMLCQAFVHSEKTVYISWLPLFHDMGLIGNVFQALYLGVLCVLLAPYAFIKKPIRWLRAISKYKGTTSGAPNFAYELCIHKISDTDLADIDLSSWDLAFNGSEIVRHTTLQNFSRKFAKCGFQEKAFYPCYGLAEATLFVTGGDKHNISKTMTLPNKPNKPQKASGYHLDNQKVVVSCGQTWLEQKIVIVNPETLLPCDEEEEGEIWIQGKNVTQGYWRQNNEDYFGYINTQEDAGSFLRTGDLGFIHECQLYVTGRLKDIIIINGINYYPEDIEYTVANSHKALRQGCCAAFAIEVNHQEQLVVVQEAKDGLFSENDNVDIQNIIRKAISQHHGISPYRVILTKAHSIPKTSSGKIQRSLCRNMFF